MPRARSAATVAAVGLAVAGAVAGAYLAGRRSAAPPAFAAADRIRIATFNIRDFGKTKAGKPAIMATLAGIVRRYDVVAVQEISDKPGTVPGRFLAEINRDGSAYAMVVSPRTGTQPDDTASQEQYAWYYDTATVAPLDAGWLYDDGAQDRFQREPQVARFRAIDGRFTFALINVHTAPDAAVLEIAALADVFAAARAAWPDEDDVIALGDFNADCDYAKPAELDALSIAGDGWLWIVPHTEDTTVSPTTDCAYDRFVATEGAKEDFTGEWGVDRSFSDPKVSDHWPVWAEFFVDRDGAGAAPACCRRCRAGKPCGDGCIAKSAACNAPKGCACAAE